MKKQDSPIVRTVKKVLPAVVSISCSKFIDNFEQPAGFFSDDFFNHPLHPPFAQQKRKKIKMGGGSGFIIDSNGIILTNRHVVEDPQAEYLVVLQNGEKLKPEILARDPLNDIAVLKVEAKNLPKLMLGDSSKLDLGQEIVAIGNALGLFQNTVSTGVVSGLSRAISAQSHFSQERTQLRGLIQTDAAINPGNSGGPLIDLTGRVIGINAAMVFGAENIGFALPINNAKKDLDDLKTYGRIRQPFLGLRYIMLDNELKEKFNLPVNFGALIIPESELEQGIIRAVIPGSPAAKAGIKQGDIILELANKKINQDKTLIDILQEHKIGQKLALKILRNNKPKTLKITLSEKK